MFGEESKSIKISENASVFIPDMRVCKTCKKYTPKPYLIIESDGLYYNGTISVYEITCEHSAVCGYIFNQLEALLDEHLDDEFHEIFKERLNGKLSVERS